MKSDISSQWLTIQEAADYLGLSVKTLYNKKSLGELRAYNLGGKPKGKVRFLKEDLDAYIRGEL